MKNPRKRLQRYYTGKELHNMLMFFPPSCFVPVDGMDPNQICEEEDNQTVLHGAVYSGNVTLVYLLMQVSQSCVPFLRCYASLLLSFSLHSLRFAGNLLFAVSENPPSKKTTTTLTNKTNNTKTTTNPTSALHIYNDHIYLVHFKNFI